MRLLLIPLAGGVGLGPMTRCLAVAFEAKTHGHEVLFLCKQEFCKIAKKFGYKAVCSSATKPYSGQKPPPFKLSDVAIALGWTEKQYVINAIETERKIIKLFKPNAIFTETQFSVPISAAVENVPWAAATGWADHPNFKSPLYNKSDSAHGFEKNFNGILNKYNQPNISDICELAFLRAKLKIAPTTPALQPELCSIPDIHFVGSLLSPEMEGNFLTSKTDKKRFSKIIAKWNQNNPLIYVYMSPGDIKPKTWIKTLIKTFRSTRFNVLVTLAPLKITPNQLPKISNICFFKSLPSMEAIQRSSVVITHGGANTVCAALIANKPLMVFPDKYAERDYNGRAVERLGAGMNFRTESFTPKELLLNAERIVSDNNFASKAQKIGAEIKKLGGSARTLDLIESII